jgi:hypothetical protein
MNFPKKIQKPNIYSLVSKDEKVCIKENIICQFLVILFFIKEGKIGKILLTLDQNSHFYLTKS